jgi:hypothetical protein
MAYNFLRGDRDQPFLLAPELRDWLPADHLAWFVLDMVDQLDLDPFLRGYRAALAGFLIQSLRLCSAAGLIRLGVIALDGTKVAANAADKANRTLDKVETEVAGVLREAAATNRAEHRQHGSALSDELPAELANPTGRLARLRQAKAVQQAPENQGSLSALRPPR